LVGVGLGKERRCIRADLGAVFYQANGQITQKMADGRQARAGDSITKKRQQCQRNSRTHWIPPFQFILLRVQKALREQSSRFKTAPFDCTTEKCRKIQSNCRVFLTVCRFKLKIIRYSTVMNARQKYKNKSQNRGGAKGYLKIAVVAFQACPVPFQKPGQDAL